LALAFGVAYLGACASDSGQVTDPGRPLFGGHPGGVDQGLPGDGAVDFELFELCKEFANLNGEVPPDVVFDVSVDAENDGNTANDPADFQVTLTPGECRDIWTDGGPTQDKVTVTEQVPTSANGTYAASYVKTTLNRMAGVPDAVVVGPSTPGNSMSEAFSGDTPDGVVGVLVVFTNTFTPTPPGGGEGCTPGFWKNRGLRLGWTAYSPGDDYATVFGVASSFTATLLEALNQGGGGEYALGRHAVAALLNAASPDVDYDLTMADVIAAVQDAYGTGDFEGTKDYLEGFNTQTAPGFCD
jgi:hypothetical protein